MDVSQMVNSAPHATNVASVTRLRTGDFSLSVNSTNKRETIGADNVQNPPIFHKYQELDENPNCKNNQWFSASSSKRTTIQEIRPQQIKTQQIGAHLL